MSLSRFKVLACELVIPHKDLYLNIVDIVIVFWGTLFNNHLRFSNRKVRASFCVWDAPLISCSFYLFYSYLQLMSLKLPVSVCLFYLSSYSLNTQMQFVECCNYHFVTRTFCFDLSPVTPYCCLASIIVWVWWVPTIKTLQRPLSGQCSQLIFNNNH